MSWIYNIFHHTKSNDTTSLNPPTVSSSQSSTRNDSDENGLDTPTFLEAEAGAIAGLLFGLLLSAAIMTAAFYFYRKQKQKNVEYQREIKTYKTSRNNAGVYMDTTEEDAYAVPGQSPAKQKSVYTSLTQNPDLYEIDSEDEI